MKIITRGQFQELNKHSGHRPRNEALRKAQKNLLKKLETLELDQGLLMDKSEWPGKYTPSPYLSRCMRYGITKKRFITRTSEDKISILRVK